MSDTCQPGSSGSSTHTHTHIHTLLNTDAIWPHTHRDTHTSTAALRVLVLRIPPEHHAERTHLSDSCAHKVIFSPLHADIQTRVMENILSLIKTQLGVTQSSAVISKKSPPPKTLLLRKGFQENSLFPGKTLTHTQTTASPFLLSLSTDSAPHSPFLSFSLFLSVLFSPSFTLSFSSSLSLSPPHTSPSTSPPLCVW